MQILVDSDVKGLISSLELAMRGPDQRRGNLVRWHCMPPPELAIRLLGMSGGRPDVPVIRLAKHDARTVGGYAIHRQELLALHNQHPGKGAWMLDDALEHGAIHLNCFDEPNLIRLYTSRGFREVRRELNHCPGGPDVVYMHLMEK